MSPAMRRDFRGAPWPTDDQRLLLTAALVPGERGVGAFRTWRARTDPEGHFGWSTFRLLPLVYHTLHAQQVRDPLMARLRGVYRRAWSETHRLFHATAPTLERLAAAGCELMLLKGAPLVQSYYRNHAVRPMSDLDVVVRRDRLAAAIAVLMREGYRPEAPVSDDRIRFFHALQFLHPGGGHIDLHWQVLHESPDPAVTEACWTRSEPGDFLGVPVRYPDPTDLLFQTVIHGVRSNEEPPIRWIPDALAVLRLRRGAIAWDRMIAQAREQRCTWRLGRGLAFLREAFEAPIPQEVLQELDGSPSLVERIENTVMMEEPGRFARSLLGTHWVMFTEYCRYADPGGPLAFARGYSEFLRYRMGLDGRRELVGALIRGLSRRVRQGLMAEAT